MITTDHDLIIFRILMDWEDEIRKFTTLSLGNTLVGQNKVADVTPPGVTWNVAAIERSGEPNVGLDGSESYRFTLIDSAVNRVEMIFNCNTIYGGYTLSVSILEFSLIPDSLPACPGLIEARFETRAFIESVLQQTPLQVSLEEVELRLTKSSEDTLIFVEEEASQNLPLSLE